MRLSPLYHWSPVERFDSIDTAGLVAGSPEVVSSQPLRQVCLGTDPRSAWRLSGAMEWASEVDVWDLWLVFLSDMDTVHVRTDYGPVVVEVQVRNSIPRERLWHVGRRSSSHDSRTDLTGVPQ